MSDDYFDSDSDTYVRPDNVRLGWVCADLVHMKWVSAMVQSQLPVVWVQGGPFLAQRRNEMVRAFMQATEEYLLIVDTDIVFSPNDITRALSHGEKVVGGLYRMAGAVQQFCAGSWADGKLVSAPHGYVKPVDFIGTGFLLVHREVFETIGEGWFNYMDAPEQPGLQIGEDLSFCHRVQDAGYQMYLDTNIRLTHLKTAELKP